MRRVSYAGQTFVTTDGMAGALVNFTAAMASNGASEPLTVPAVDDHWVPISVDLVVGPTSEVLSIPFDEGDNGLETGVAVHDLEERTGKLTIRSEQSTEARPLEQPVPMLDDTEL